ncbi:MAG: amidohydrolase, partial [Betaproteobacteria bacterium]|nr:amidohydrolase [Betaproteobacteria bacterium]
RARNFLRDLVLEAARLHPDRFAAMGRLDNVPPPTRDMIAKWREQPGMLGLRCSLTRRQATATLDGLDWLWEEAEKAGVPIMILAPHPMMHLVDRIASRYPALNLVMSHLGLTTGTRDEEAFRDLDKLLALAKRPNVAVKASALPAYTSDSYPYRALHPYLRRVYDAFGPRRMFWGTDLARLPCSYRQAVTMFTEEIPWLTAKDKEWIMGRGLCEWLGWELARA